MDEPWKHAKWNKLDTKGQILYDSTYIYRIGKFIETESRIKVARGWGEGKMATLWNDEIVLEIVVVVAEHCEYN